MRIVFFGTPEFSVEVLKTLHQHNKNIVAVVTAPDKPSGRGRQLSPSAVKEYALQNNLPVLQPEKLKSPEFIEQLKILSADLFIVVAFRMLPEVVWNMPPKGTFNLHASLLPQYRGAAPINWAIINGETKTGITTFFLQHKIDTGNIIFREEIEILPTDNAGTLHDKLMIKGAQLVLKTVNTIEENKITITSQSDLLNGKEELKHAPKIFKETCKIDWHNNAEAVHNLIRGLSPYPAAYTELTNKEKEINIKVFSGNIAEALNDTTQIGQVKTDNKSFLKIACADAWYNITELQASGKKRMPIADFLRGMSLIADYKVKAE